MSLWQLKCQSVGVHIRSVILFRHVFLKISWKLVRNLWNCGYSYLTYGETISFNCDIGDIEDFCQTFPCTVDHY